MELIKIDGLWYDDDLNEVAAPAAENDPQEIEIEKIVPKSVTIGDVTLTEGSTEANYFGTYLVLGFSDDEEEMTVRYLTADHMVKVGEEKTYPVKAQAETISKSRRRERAALKSAKKKVKAVDFSGDADSVTLAFIKQHGRISAEVPPHRVEQFHARYSQVTGDTPENHLGSGYYPVKNPDWWGDTLCVNLPVPKPEDANKLDLPDKGVSVYGDRLVIANNSYVWGLFYKGFHIGRNADNEMAQTSV